MNIFIASGHRSGSMHISYSLAAILGYQVTSALPCLSGGVGEDEHMIHPFVAQTLFPLDRLIFHQHVKATKGNEDLIRAYDIKAIVTIRNIFDVMLSIKEKMDKGIYVPCIPSMVPWPKTSEDTKWAWLAYNVVPWNLQFYASWATSEVPALFVKYEKFYSDEAVNMLKILEFLNLKASEETVRLALRDDKTNLNVGGSGRGVKVVPCFVKDIVVSQIDTWDDVSLHMKRDLL